MEFNSITATPNSCNFAEDITLNVDVNAKETMDSKVSVLVTFDISNENIEREVHNENVSLKAGANSIPLSFKMDASGIANHVICNVASIKITFKNMNDSEIANAVVVMSTHERDQFKRVVFPFEN